MIIENNNIIQLDSLGSVSNGEQYNIEGEVINSHELIAFGTAFNHFIPARKITPIESEKVTEFKEEYFYKNKSLIIKFISLSLTIIIPFGIIFFNF